MSFTTVSNTTETYPHRTTRILLTPTKRQRVSNETRKEGCSDTKAMESPNMEEIWKWTMTPDAIATCFVRDVFDMRENLEGGADFYWLGRVPCRTVCLIGLVVGVQVFEGKILYSIDDGTAVIDCAHRVQRAPKTLTKKDKPHFGDSKFVMRDMPKPVARIGLSVRVVGKVQRAYGTRQVQIDDVELCRSRNEEPLHWIKVRELHKTNYDVKEQFVIPKPPAVPVVAEPSTPSTIVSSPVSSVANSPVKRSTSPPRLRHPSRLHSRDLTDNTFRIYVKHYMVYAPSVVPVSDDPDLFGGPSTPTKRVMDQLTPLPANSKMAAIDRTPRHRNRHTDSSGLREETICHRGFTLSYLRRVPELAEMARRVVVAEAKRRAKEHRKKGAERRSQESAPLASSSAGLHDLPRDKVGSKVKRLFKWVVVQLLHEGSIVLWDGPMHACGEEAHAEMLWKTCTSISTNAEKSGFGQSGEGHDELLDEELSDPAADEEGYMPITSLFLARYIEDVIRELSGATKEGILRKLHRDDRWRFIGEWQIQDALEYLQQESRAWRIGDKWALTA